MGFGAWHVRRLAVRQSRVEAVLAAGGIVVAERGLSELAEVYTDRLGPRHPQLVAVGTSLVETAARLHGPARARREFARLSPHWPQSAIRRAETAVLIAEGRYAAAEELAAGEPGLARQLARAVAGQGRYAQAAALYQGDTPGIRVERATVQALAGDSRSAIAAAGPLAEGGRPRVRARAQHCLAVALLLENEYTEALGRARLAVALRRDQPDTAAAHTAGFTLTLAAALRGLGYLPEAEAELRVALDTLDWFYGPGHPMGAHAQLVMGEVLADADQPDRARTYLAEVAAVLDPRHPSALRAAALLTKLGPA